MNYEQKIKFLRGYLTAESNIEAYQKQIERMRESMMPSSPKISDIPKHPNYDDPMAKYAGEFWEVSKKIEKAHQRQLAVVGVINSIAESDPDGHLVLTYQYIVGMRKKDIELDMGIGRMTRQRMHRRAVEELKI